MDKTFENIRQWIVRVLILILIGIGFPLACGQDNGNGNGGNGESEDVIDLDPGEVREYEGQDLSRIDEFRENSIKGPQYVEVETYSLAVTGLVETPLSYTYDQVVNNFQNYRKVVTLYCVEGWNVTLLWEGALVEDLIAPANPSPEAEVIIFHAYDGYTTSLKLDYIQDQAILMDYKMNDVVLPPERGFPFQLVAESKWGYKWIKWITKIELSDDTEYRGFWESFGYSNEGDLPE